MDAVIQEVTGSISFLVKLQDGRRHQDHLRSRNGDSDVKQLIPEILIDSDTFTSNLPVQTGETADSSTDSSTTTTDSHTASATAVSDPPGMVAQLQPFLPLTLEHLRDSVSHWTGCVIIKNYCLCKLVWLCKFGGIAGFIGLSL